MVAQLFQRNFIFSVVFEGQRLLQLGLEFILLLISVWIYSFLCHPLCTFSFQIIFLVVFSFGWESEIFAIGIWMPQLMLHKVINFKTLTLIETQIIQWMLSLKISEFSRLTIYLIPFSLIVLRWLHVVSSSLHFFGTTALVYVYFVFVLFKRFCLSFISHIHTIILSELSFRFLRHKLRLNWSSMC